MKPMKINNISYVAPEEMISSGDSSTPIPVEDTISISTGTHKGRIKMFSTFKSKDKKIMYAKLTVGTQINLSDGQQAVVELDRVWHADFRQGSQLIQTLEKLGAIRDKQVFPDELFNQPVQFEVSINDNYTPSDGKYKELVSSVERIESLPDELDFQYVHVDRIGFTEIVATNHHMQHKEVLIDEEDDVKSDFDKLFDDDDDE